MKFLDIYFDEESNLNFILETFTKKTNLFDLLEYIKHKLN